VGRPATLTGDPLRLAAPLAVTRAVQRLDHEASTAWPLGAADRGLASLTCARFDALLDPPRGDDALAAALARYGAASDAPVATAPLAVRDRFERTARVPPSVWADAVRSGVRAPRPVRTPVARQVDPASVSAAAPRSGSTLTADPPRRAAAGRTTVAEGLGLEWFTAADPHVREAADAPVALEPAARRLASPQQATPGTTPTIIGNPPARVRPPSSSANAETASRRGHPSPLTAAEAPPRPVATAAHSAPMPTIAGGTGLESLVRAWNVTHPEAGSPEAENAEPEPTAASVAFDERPGPGAVGDAPRPGHSSAARVDSVSGEELLDLRDEVGRMLVAELRRYGIEVGP